MGELNITKVNLEISLHALIGSHNPKIMRVNGTIGTTSITILIDIESTHNFLGPAIVKRTTLS